MWPHRVLLTGANGFLGVFLLRELLRQTDAVVHCLVRGANAGAARGRLRDALTWYRLAGEVDLGRVVVEVGDLAEPGMGLTQERFDYLARVVEAVYHAGALVNSNYAYDELRPTNILGTQQVLRLAAQTRTVPIHFLSTGSVFPPLPAGKLDWRPDDVPGPVEALRTGYSQSKLVAEQILGVAADRGMPISTYRIDRVWGDQRNGACQTDDFFWLALKGCVQAGVVPDDVKALFTLVPVDYAAAALVALSMQTESAGRLFHMSNAEPFSLGTGFDWLRDMGYRLDPIPREEWKKIVAASDGNAAQSLVEVLDRRTSLGEVLPTAFDSTHTDKALADMGMVCPSIDRELFETYVRFQVETGWLPATP